MLVQRQTRLASTSGGPSSLLLIEHQGGKIDAGTLSALTAASQMGGEVTGLVVGTSEEVKVVLDSAKKLKGLTKVLHSSSPLYGEPLAEQLTPLLQEILKSNAFTHLLASHSTTAKSLLPRLAATLDLPAISDITSVKNDSDGSTTFERPIYAGNAISTVKAPSTIPLKIFTVRGTAFDKAGLDGSPVEDSAVNPVDVPDVPTQHLKTSLTQSDRPDLGVANKVVSGGRALKSAEIFSATLHPLADVLGAAVGASRAAVDAGYADNSLQVGQTGKIVAPELYVALGISGAIQHLAGMKDSKLIVAVNKDPDAPIFQVADVGLVADLFEAVPQMVEKLKK
ncbi:Electron transfer flavoprotein alpha-subunit [Tulasnella sp. 331]|nr:Electron transfer flavoprotein alpha-subunit [Tulasnella sp. 331]KAG8884818.1 Electron transfer flavoprotein alpha-subunit [Tulasnella sp. 332]